MLPKDVCQDLNKDSLLSTSTWSLTEDRGWETAQSTVLATSVRTCVQVPVSHVEIWAWWHTPVMTAPGSVGRMETGGSQSLLTTQPSQISEPRAPQETLPQKKGGREQLREIMVLNYSLFVHMCAHTCTGTYHHHHHHRRQ